MQLSFENELKLSHSVTYQDFSCSVFLAHFLRRSTFRSLKHHQDTLWFRALGHYYIFFSLPPHHLLFPHLFLQPPHFPWSLPHLSLIPTDCHPPPPPPPACLALHHSTCIQHRSQDARASSGLYIHAVRTLCCTTLQCVFFHSATTESRLHEQGQRRQTHPTSPSSILSICLFLLL